MGNFIYSVHNSQDGKLYNVLGRGQLPTVVFGRVIRPNSVPGMQYYFMDGRVKWHDNNHQIGYSYSTPFPKNPEAPDEKWGEPCIFTIPENFDFSNITNLDYVMLYTRKAKEIDANTTSPNYIIRGGKLICIKTIDVPGSGVVVARHSFYKRMIDEHNYKITHGKRIKKIQYINSREGDKSCRNKFVLIPVGRVKYKHVCGQYTFYRYKQSIYHYNIRKIVKGREGGSRVWKYKIL